MARSGPFYFNGRPRPGSEPRIKVTKPAQVRVEFTPQEVFAQFFGDVGDAAEDVRQVFARIFGGFAQQAQAEDGSEGEYCPNCKRVHPRQPSSNPWANRKPLPKPSPEVAVRAALSVLDLPPEADEEDIKQRRRELARELHPDVGGDDEALERLKEVNAAADLLLESGSK